MGSRSRHSAKSYGTPMDSTKPSKRKRPKVGDKDPDYKKPAPHRNKKRPPTSSKPDTPPKKPEGSVFRDYRGTEGVIDDASGIKRKK